MICGLKFETPLATTKVTSFTDAYFIRQVDLAIQLEGHERIQWEFLSCAVSKSMFIVQILVAQSTDKAWTWWNEPILNLRNASFDILRELHKIAIMSTYVR